MISKGICSAYNIPTTNKIKNSIIPTILASYHKIGCQIDDLLIVLKHLILLSTTIHKAYLFWVISLVTWWKYVFYYTNYSRHKKKDAEKDSK